MTNEAGAAVPNAAVTVTPVSGGSPQHTIADQDGKFTVTGLPPALYTVNVESPGYKRLSTQNIDLTNASTAAIQVRMQRGNSTETVKAEGSVIAIQTDNGQKSNAWEVRTVTETPVYDRNHQQLVELTTGITPPYTNPNTVLDPQQSRYWETNGQSSGANRRTLDGNENTEPFAGTAIYSAPLESIQQMNLMTSNYDAQYGRAAGTILNSVTRTGTNDIHGSVFEYNSVSAMAARDFFNPKGYPQAKFTFNQTGASIGGPIVKNRTFFFADFEADLNHSQVPTVSTVPTAAMRAGDFSAVPGLVLYNPASGLANGTNRSPFPNNVIPGRSISPVSNSILPYFPAPNASGFENNLAVNVPLFNDGFRGDIRLDHKMRDSLNLYARASYSDYSTLQGSPLGVLGGSDGHLQNANAMVGMTNALSTSLIMDLKLSFIRYGDKLNNTTPLSASQLGIADPSAALLAGSGFSNPGIPSINVAGLQPFGSYGSYPQYNTENNWNLTNSWNLIVGRHNFHFGADIYWIRPNGFQNYAGPGGTFAFGPGTTASPAGAGLGPYGSFANSFAAFLLGTPTQTARNLPGFNPGYTSWQASGYVADTIKITDRLTVDLGARYDVFSPLEPNRANGEFIYSPATQQLMPLGQNGVDTVGNRQINWNNIAPRVGFAFRPTEKTVIRAGYGINYYQGPLNFYAASLMSNFGLATGGLGSGFATAGSFNQLPSLNTLATTATGPIPAPNSQVFFSPNNMRTPYVQNFDFLVQQDLGYHGLVLNVGYVGNLGRELPYSLETNAAAPGTGVAGQPLSVGANGRTASTVEALTGLTSNYNSLQVSLNKHFGNSLSFTTAYTYSKALDYGAGGLTPLLNNLDVRANYGPADWNRQQMFTFSHVWQIPFGAGTNHYNQGLMAHLLGPWQIDGVLSWVSGTPFTITADPTLCNCPGNTPTASTVVTGVSRGFTAIPTFFGFLPVPYQALNFAYTQPPSGNLGNLGRNSVVGPGYTNYNMSLFRNFFIHEGVKLEFRAEAYNISNTAHFANPIANVNDANFGQSISTLPYDPSRRLQLAFRVQF